MPSNKFDGIYVRPKTDNSSQTLVTISGYKAGFVPVLLVNSLPTWAIEYGDKGRGNRKYLQPGEKVRVVIFFSVYFCNILFCVQVLFTWDKPSGVRSLSWRVLRIC